MTTIKSFNCRTGEHNHPIGTVHALYDGPSFAGYYLATESGLVEVSGFRMTLNDYVSGFITFDGQVLPLQDRRPYGFQIEDYTRKQVRFLAREALRKHLGRTLNTRDGRIPVKAMQRALFALTGGKEGIR